MKTLSLFLSVILFFALFRLPGTPAVAQSPPPLVEKQWTVDGVARQALLAIPPKATTDKTPVIFAFHGHGGSMRQASRSFGYEKQWPEAIIVYMQGLNTPGQLTDPTGRLPGWQKHAGDQNDRDLKFFDVVLASLKTDYKVDEARIFATGHSNGGSFTYVLWANRGKIFRAVAPSSAIPGASAAALTPKPALHLAGENDPLVRYAWQQRTMENEKRLNGCGTEGTPWGKSGTLVGTLYSSKSGTPLVTLIHPGQHTFPAGASELIVRFFKENSATK